MTAKIIAITQPIGSGKDFCSTPGELIAYCARISNPSNQASHNTSAKLLSYCFNEQHWSIFEMISVTFEINTTRDIGRQIIRHKSFSFQEFSQRYAQAAGFTSRECRLQDTTDRQNSIETDDKALVEWWNSAQLEVKNYS